MPELPEITVRAREMREELLGKRITGVEVLQPKCLNVPEKEFADALTGAEVREVTNKGKWLFVATSKGWLLLNLGMGGEMLLVTPGTLPEKRRLVFGFDDGSCLSVNFWWFGYAHYVPPDRLGSHAMTAGLGPNALDVTTDELKAMLKGRRGRIKSFLLDQSRLAGIGNAYVHDILFLARLHPLRSIATLSDHEIEALAEGIRGGLQPSTMDDVLVGYREGKPCPECGTPIEKTKTGSTSSFVCPECQPLR
jgi:formamidopyrimidine-DNA glycosylase